MSGERMGNVPTFCARDTICLLVLIGMLVSPVVAAAQEEKPQKEPTFAEAKAAFAKTDRALNEAWSAVKTALSGRELTEATQAQRDWLEFRDGRAKEESELAGEKDVRRSAHWHTTAAELSESRAQWLRARAQAAKTMPETLTGSWIDSYGGTMQLVQQEGRLLFNIDVVRGPTYHTGGVAGVASWNDRIGWWSDKGREAEKTEESNLAFVDRGGVLEVIGANTSYYHGARAYFDGLYCKVGPLDPKEQAEVSKTAESGEVPEPEQGGD